MQSYTHKGLGCTSPCHMAALQQTYSPLGELHPKLFFTSALYLLQRFWDCWVFWISCLSTMPVTASSPEGRQSSLFSDSRLVVLFYSALPKPFHLSLIRPSLFDKATRKCDLDIFHECNDCWTKKPHQRLPPWLKKISFFYFSFSMQSCWPWCWRHLLNTFCTPLTWTVRIPGRIRLSTCSTLSSSQVLCCFHMIQLKLTSGQDPAKTIHTHLERRHPQWNQFRNWPNNPLITEGIYGAKIQLPVAFSVGWNVRFWICAALLWTAFVSLERKWK